jgi:hypothetical protein
MGMGHTPVEVGGGEQVTGIDEVLLPASYLLGTVTDNRCPRIPLSQAVSGNFTPVLAWHR